MKESFLIFVWYLIGLLLGLKSRIGYIYICDDQKPLSAPPPKGIRIVKGGEQDINALIAIKDKPYEKLKKRIDIGNILYILKDGEDCLGYTWVSKDKQTCPSDRVTAFLPEGAFYLYDSFIHQKYRSKHLYSFLLNEVMRDITQNKNICSCYIDKLNTASIVAHEKNNFNKVMLILMLNSKTSNKLTVKFSL